MALLVLSSACAALAFGPSSTRPLVVLPRLSLRRAPAPLLADRSAHAIARAPPESPGTPDTVPTSALTLAPIWLAVLVQMLGVGVTLSTLPLYLRALSGKGAHLVTVNDYLARRDAEALGPLYNYLGLSVGVVQLWGGMHTVHGVAMRRWRRRRGCLA